jgi:hypothetical protein
MAEKSCKNFKNHLRSNNYEVCTAVARCFPNILDVMVLENINFSSDKIGRPPLWSTEVDLYFFNQSPTYAVKSVYFNHTLISYIHWSSMCLISVRKLHNLPFILFYQLNSVHTNLLTSKGDD